MLLCFGIGFCLNKRELRKTAEADELKKQHARVAFEKENMHDWMQWVGTVVGAHMLTIDTQTASEWQRTIDI